MSVQTGEAVPSGPASQRLGDRARFRLDRVLSDPNPIWIRELKQAVRLARTPVILCVLTMLMTMLIAGIGGIATAENSPSTTGIILFHTYFSLAYFVVTLVGPTVAANGIAAEREGRTWEAVLLAGLEPGMIARGKFLAAYTTISLYIVMLAPVGALPFLFGGVTATETIVAFLFLFLIALMSVAFGLSISSKMTSMRGAIAVTLLLALPFSVLTFLLFGPGLSVVAHKAWSSVPDGPPIWLPTAYSRAPFDATYVLALFVTPVIAVVVPSWFMYEVTIANLTSPTDDRTTGLKRWFLVCTPILTVVGIAPLLDGSLTARETAGLSMVSIGLLLIVLTFAIFLFQGDAIGPSRRVTAHWDRRRASAFARWMGPSVTRTSTLQLLVGLIGLGVLTVLGAALSEARKFHDDSPSQMVLLYGFYAAGFYLFLLGAGALSRVRAKTSMGARLALAAILLALVITPWVVTAIVGVLSSDRGFSDDMLSIAAPSPIFVFVAVAKIESSSSGSALPAAAVVCSAFYAVLGFVLLGSARARSNAIIEKHEIMLAQTDRLLAEEDAAAESARAEAEEAQSAAPPPPEPAPMSGWGEQPLSPSATTPAIAETALEALRPKDDSST